VGVWWMDRATFLPASWEDLRWWVNTAKRLMNDISGGVRVVHAALWPRWKDTSQAKLPNLLI
jgi:hypothetical protein